MIFDEKIDGKEILEARKDEDLTSYGASHKQKEDTIEDYDDREAEEEEEEDESEDDI